jgi:ADP-dependent NAD(P)H-hydrate dehydratase / NAD(P)H-hydrate epimerase
MSETRFEQRAVIDADGLNWLATRPDWPSHLRQSQLVLTPHPGELSRLLGVSVDEIVADPWSSAREAAARFGQVVVLKHAHAVAAAPDGRLAVSPQAQPALASAGTGDVLGGIIAGLLAQGVAPFDAAWSGLYIGSLATELAVRRIGTVSLVASDVIAALPQAMMSLYDSHW